MDTTTRLPAVAATARLSAPVLLSRLSAGAVGLVGLPDTGPAQSLPLESSQSGSVFADRFDATLGWYLPVVGAADPDTAFGYAATIAGVDAASGDPFDTALLTLTLSVTEPPDLDAARVAHPGVTYQPLPLDGPTVTLTLVGKAPDGSDQPVAVEATVTDSTPSTVTVQASLVGAAVVLAYDNLMTSGTASLCVASSYTVWRQWRPPVRTGPGWWRRGPVLDPGGVQRFPQLWAGPVAGGVQVPVQLPRPVGPFHPVDPPVLVDHPVPVDPPVPVWTTAVHTRSDVVALGTAYARDGYRTRCTISVGGVSRPIVDVGDLRDVTGTRSEFRELTSLGDPAIRYPSVRRLYLGEVSGTVVVVPQSYGVLRGSAGTAVACQAVVDDSTTSTSGCRFDLTAVLGPAVDPVELAQLAHDLGSVPEAQGRSLQLTMPGGLDARTPSSFPVFAGAVAHLADGPLPHMVVLTLTVADTDGIPAVCNVNALLGQLASPTTPLAGEVVVRLDDAYPTPVGTSLVLSLSDTVGTDDVSLVVDPTAGTAVTVTNAGPVPLAVSAVASVTAAGPVLTDVGVTLASGEATTVTPADVAAPTVVRRRLAVPDPLVKPGVFAYVDLDVTTVSQVQHPLGVDAAFDLVAAGVAQLDLAWSLDDYPGVAVSPLTLTPTHRIDTVHAVVPVDVVVSGLRATVQVTVTGTDGSSRDVVLQQDFVDHPVLTITSASIGR